MPTRPVRFRALGKILLEALSHLRPGDLRCSVPIEILFSLWLSLCRCHHSSPLVSCAFVSTRLQFCSPLRAVHLRASATSARDPSYNCFPSVFSPGQPGKRYLFSKSNTKTNILKEPFLARLSHTLLHFSPRCAESAWSCLWQQRGVQPLVGTLASPRHPPRQQYPL